MQPFQIIVLGKKAAVELVDRVAAESPPFVHCPEEPQNLLPNICTIGVEIRIGAAVSEEFLKKLRWEGERLTHVLAEEDEDAAVEDLLRKSNQPTIRSGEARGRGSVLRKQRGIKPLSEFTIFVVKTVLQLPVLEPLECDQRQ